MLRLHAIRHGAFTDIEVLNPRFVAGAQKLKVTVDTEPEPRAAEAVVVHRLLAAFPGLARHECRVQKTRSLLPAEGTAIRLVTEDASANQAHLLEHLLIEMLAVFEPRIVRSGVTCAWREPAWRNDIFVECERADIGSAVAALGVRALDQALEGNALVPLYADLLRVWSLLERGGRETLSETLLQRRAGLTRDRVAPVLELLAESALVTEERLTLNLSDVRHWRAR